MRRRRVKSAATLASTLLCLAMAGCASAPPIGARPAPFPGAAPPAWASRRSPTPEAARSILSLAVSMQGTPYLFGGAAPETGFDCSGLVRYVFGRLALDVPRTVAEQFHVGRAVARTHVSAADLLFFSTTGPGATHVGIVVDPDARTFVHAPGTGAVVRIERFDTPYWQARMIGARRLPLDAGAF